MPLFYPRQPRYSRQNFMDSHHPRQNFNPRHPRHPGQNFMDQRYPRHPRQNLTHATQGLMLFTPPTNQRYSYHLRYLADSHASPI